MRNSLRLSMIVPAAIASLLIPATARSQDIGIVQSLVTNLGVSQSQALGGATAILGLAQTNLGPAEFAQLAGAVPDIGNLMGISGDEGETAAAVAAPVGDDAAPAPSAPATPSSPAAPPAPTDEAAGQTTDAPAAPGLPGADVPGVPTGADAPEAPTGADMALASGGVPTAMPQISGLDALSKNPDLVSKFAGFGMDSGMIAQFAPIMLQSVMGSGGMGAAELLGKGLGLGLP